MDDATRNKSETEIKRVVRKHFRAFKTNRSFQKNLRDDIERPIQLARDRAARAMLAQLNADSAEGKRALDAALKADTYPADRAAKLAADMVETNKAGYDRGIDRAISVGITETTAAASVGQQIAADVAQQFSKRKVKLQWQTHKDDRVCPICKPLHGFSERRWRKLAPDGPPLHPRCVLGETPVAFSSLIAVCHAKYYGPVVRLHFQDGSRFRVTANHMLLSGQGFIRAADIVKGDYILRTPLVEDGFFPPRSRPYYDRQPILAKQVFDAFAISFGMLPSRVPVASEYLHGDAAFVDRKIDVIRSNRELPDGPYSSFSQPYLEHGFVSRLLFKDSPLFVGSRNFASVFEALLNATDGGVGTFRERDAIRFGQARHANLVGFAAGADGQTHLLESVRDNCSRYAESLRHVQSTFPGVVSSLEVVEVDVDSSHDGVSVYDFETEETMYLIGNGIISSNCRCVLVPKK